MRHTAKFKIILPQNIHFGMFADMIDNAIEESSVYHEDHTGQVVRLQDYHFERIESFGETLIELKKKEKEDE